MNVLLRLFVVETLFYICKCSIVIILMYIAVACPSLTDPDNGIMTCLLGDDGISFYKDTCTFICNVGYILSGSHTRTCQSDGRWSGSDARCRKGCISVFFFVCFNSCMHLNCSNSKYSISCFCYKYNKAQPSDIELCIVNSMLICILLWHRL